MGAFQAAARPCSGVRCQHPLLACQSIDSPNCQPCFPLLLMFCWDDVQVMLGMQVLKALGLMEDEKKPPRAEALKRARGKAPLSLPHGAGAHVTRCGLSFTCAVLELLSHYLFVPVLHAKPHVTMTEHCYISSERPCSLWLWQPPLNAVRRDGRQVLTLHGGATDAWPGCRIATAAGCTLRCSIADGGAKGPLFIVSLRRRGHQFDGAPPYAVLIVLHCVALLCLLSCTTSATLHLAGKVHAARLHGMMPASAAGNTWACEQMRATK